MVVDNLIIEDIGEGKAAITGVCDKFIEVDRIIPKTMKGLLIVSIGEYAFSECNQLKRVDIPDSVMEIHSHAFDKCKKLEHVSIPESIDLIDEFIFNGCINLTSLYIPKAIREIPHQDYFFVGLTNLKSINVSEENENYKSIDGVLFNKSGDALICYPLGKKCKNYVIPEGVVSIGRKTIINAESITFPLSINKIDSFRFWKNSYLKSITIPSHIKTIGDKAFFECENLSEVTIENGVKIIEDCAFCNCKKLEKVTIPDSVTMIEESAFASCSSLREVNGLGKIDVMRESIFSGCSSLENLIIPNSVTKIEKFALAHSGFKNFNIPDSVESIDKNVFSNSSLETLSVGNSISKYYMEDYGENFSSLYLGSGVTDLEICPYNHPRAKEVVVSEDNKHFKSIDGVLFDKEGKTLIYYPISRKESEYIVPEGVTKIGPRAFEGCTLDKVILPDSVKVIGEKAFFGSELKEINMSANIERIEFGAFQNAMILREIAIPSSIQYIDANTFGAFNMIIKIDKPKDSLPNFPWGDCLRLTVVWSDDTVKYNGY